MKIDNSELIKYIQQILPMPLNVAQLVAEKFSPLELGKNEFLVKENKVTQYTYFLQQGYIRSYTYNNEGAEVTTNIHAAPCFVSDYLSFFKQIPTKENLETLSNCIIWQMSYTDVQVNFHSIPQFREFGRMMLVTNYSKLHNRMLSMIKENAEERYSKMLKEEPQLIQNIPLKIIASYLGIKDTSLSRIRKELMLK